MSRGNSWLTWPLLLLAVISIAGKMPSDSFLDKSVEISGGEIGRICKEVDMPCGIEQRVCGEFPGPGDGPKSYPEHPRTMTVRRLFDWVVSQVPGYRWTIRQGVVNIEPRKHRREDPLAAKIRRISFKGIPSDSALARIVYQARSEKGMPVSLSRGTGFRDWPKVDIELRDATVREALNAVAKADGHLVWWVCPDGNSGTILSPKVYGW